MSLYFSILTPTPGMERQAAHVWAGGAYVEHQWLWQLLPASQDTPRDFLYRRRDVDGLPRFYLLSQRPLQPPHEAWQVQMKPYDPDIQRGDKMRFELRANPTVSRAGSGSSKRHDVVMDAKRRLLAERGLRHWRDWQSDDKPSLYALVQEHGAAWLHRRATVNGFEVDSGSLSVEGYQQHAYKNGVLRFTTVDFSGELTVTNADAFNRVLRKGVGHGKAFGCGLLLVRPISRTSR